MQTRRRRVTLLLAVSSGLTVLCSTTADGFKAQPHPFNWHCVLGSRNNPTAQQKIKNWQNEFVIVPAVYNEWLVEVKEGDRRDPPEADAFTRQRLHPHQHNHPDPAHDDKAMKWHFPSWTRDHAVYMYQRLSEDHPCFSPNHAHEGGIYLQFVVDHVPDNLPAYVLFAQADWFRDAESRRDRHRPLLWQEECLRRRVNIDGSINEQNKADIWVPLGQTFGIFPPKFKKRSVSLWAGGRRDPATVVVVEQCWRDMLREFNATMFPPKKQPCIHFYPYDNMIVSREQIMKHDPCVWKNAYIKLVSAATCHRSIFDKTVLSTESLNHYLEGSAGQRRGRRGLLGTEAVDLVGNLDDVGTYMKHAASGTLEHLNHVIWGGKPPHMDGVDFATVYDHECMCNLNSEGLCHSADSLAVVQHVDADSDCDGHKFSDAL